MSDSSSDSIPDLSVPGVVWSGPWTTDSEDETAMRVVVDFTDVVVEIQDKDAMGQPKWAETDDREIVIWALKKLAILSI